MSTYLIEQRNQDIKKAINTTISEIDDGELISVQNNIVSKRIVFRSRVIAFPHGVTNHFQFLDGPYDHELSQQNTERVFAKYVIIDQMRPPSLGDKGCDWLYGRCNDMNALKEYNKKLQYVFSRYEPLYDSGDGFMILKKDE